MSGYELSHDGAVALLGLWAAVAITAFPFTLEWKRPFYGRDAPARTHAEFGGFLACLMWPVLPLGVAMLLVVVPIMWVIEQAPRCIVEWWSKPWGAR